jgi:DNA-binding beta-propeller fold protein YncE
MARDAMRTRGLAGHSRDRMIRFRFCLLLIALIAPLAAPFAAEPLQLVQTISVAVKGRIDHFALDADGKRLFVAALANHSVEVVDVVAGTPVRSLRGFSKPQGLAYLSDPPRLFVADGDRDTVTLLDGNTFAPIQGVAALGDADNLRYGAQGERVYVGYGAGAIRILDARTAAPLGDVRLPAHPEGFALARDEKRLFANVPDAGAVIVVDLERREIAQRWSVGDARANFPLAIDATAGRVFVATRQPAALHVFDAGSGRRIAQIAIDGDADDLFFDGETGRLYAICGAGTIDVIQAVAADRYSVVARVPTRPGARTGLFAPAAHRLYVGVPGSGAVGAEIRVFAVAASGQ